MKNYHEFIKNKIEISPLGGFEIDESTLPEILKPHQRDIVKWPILDNCEGWSFYVGVVHFC